jgi:tetratricopeptide (TPR) repeat protein
MQLDRARRIDAETCKIEEGSLRGDQLALAYSNRALAYLARGDVDPAISDFNEAIRLAPDLPYERFLRGRAYAKAGELDLAIADFSAYLQQRPRAPDVLEERADVYERKGEYGLAAADRTKAEVQHAEDENDRVNVRGLYALQRGDFEGAIDALKALTPSECVNLFAHAGYDLD